MTTREATGAEPSRIDVTDMYAVHQVFRDAFASAPTLIGGVADGDAPRTALLANFYDNILSFLHVHHDGEEELIFPRLRDRCAANLALVDRIAEQHRDVDDLFEASKRSLDAWAAAGGGARGRVVDDVSALGNRLVDHLDEEEEQILPLCAAHLSAQEWGELPGHAMAAFDGDKIWLVAGLIRERMSDVHRKAMDDHMPPPARAMWENFGAQAFADLMTEVGPLGS